MVAQSNSASAWQIFRKTFDQHLLTTLREDCIALPLQQDAFLQELFGHTQALAQHGKRVRPYIASLAYQAAGGDVEQQPWIAWIGIELIHLFALIHDDLIDQGKLRHGVETVQTFVARRLQEHHRNGHQPRIADSQALLVGDMVYTWALKHLTEALRTFPAASSASHVLFELLEEVIVGQSLDVDLTSRKAQPYELIEQKILLKTARYTFVRPMQLGIAFSGTASKELFHFCEKFGDSLGLAFQLQDDVLDVMAQEEQTGKSSCRDIEEAQQTFLTCYLEKEGTPAQKEQLHRLMGYPLSNEQKNEVRMLFTDVGAIEHCERLIETHFSQAEHLIQQAHFLSEASKHTFQLLISTLKTRST